jgi:hypothetical protein
MKIFLPHLKPKGIPSDFQVYERAARSAAPEKVDSANRFAYRPPTSHLRAFQTPDSLMDFERNRRCEK